jgi:uncharacterized protein
MRSRVFCLKNQSLKGTSRFRAPGAPLARAFPPATLGDKILQKIPPHPVRLLAATVWRNPLSKRSHNPNRRAGREDRCDEPQLPFWRRKRLEELDAEEWEQLCDGCGRCCLNKLEDEDTGDIHLTRLACRLLDLSTCRCKDYANRKARVPECVKIDVETVRQVKWLPPTCAYRLVAEERDLFWWHPLVSGTPETVHDAGISVRGLARSERGVKIDAYWRYIIDDFG